MEKLIVTGGRPLHGTVDIGGAKNAAVAIIPATLMADGPCVLENVPVISDVSILMDIMQDMGAEVHAMSSHSYVIDSRDIKNCEIQDENARRMRASYYYLGVGLSKFGKASVALPGGCDLGARPIDQHLKAFEALGAKTDVDQGIVYVDAGSGLKGAHIFFDIVSVGATINAMLAAVKAEGRTILENVAKEPHIVDVANFLNKMGADIRGAGTDVIKIRGVSSLKGAQYSIIPDQIEAGTFIAAAVATGGNVKVNNITPKHLETIISRMREVGAEILVDEDSLTVTRKSVLCATNVRTMPHPGFPTDMVPQFSVLLSMAEGTSIITEGIWSNRFRYADELRRMGASFTVDGKIAVISGVERLQAAPVMSTDLRAGAAMVIAGLCAQGTTEVSGVEYIDRGYEDFVGKLSRLGADVKRIQIPDPVSELAAIG
ncbi:MAG: UDP-N-acetylglucosamine 1-carboxyvinyltransferase [Oscillospiraceae bacterium]|nr:UDP-N-acetylglucosamine 1-carboxyvinyltransferase [Oscillospiraceae bacterium]